MTVGISWKGNPLQVVWFDGVQTLTSGDRFLEMRDYNGSDR